jgi:probable HAF family extracellular repeat protein
MTKFAHRLGPCRSLVTLTIPLWLALLGLLLLFPALASGARIFPTYNLVNLDTLPGGDRSYAYGINNANQVVGYSSIPPDGIVIFHAFRYSYSKGTMTDLGTLGGRTSYAYGINNAGQVTGYSEPTEDVDHAFLYGSGGMIDLGVLPGANTSMGYAINNLGLVVGKSMVPPPSGSGFFPYHAFLYSGGPLIDLGTTTTPGYDQTEAYGINDDGWVVGKTTPPGGGLGHGFLYDGTMMDIGAEWEAYGYYSEARGINNAGQVVMTAIAKNGSGAFAVIYEAGEATMIASLGTGNSNGRALGINNRGEVVGKLADNRAFLYVPENGLVELSSLVVGTNPFAQLNVANAINDLGYIAGNGTLPDGSERAFLAVPGTGKITVQGYVPYLLLLLD